MPSALLVGPGSMLGGRLKERLILLGWDVTTAGRSLECNIFMDLEHLTLDQDFDVEADVLFHCAGAFGNDSPQGCWLNEKVNSLGSHQVAALARMAGCKQIVYAGTVFSIYENEPRALNSYGASKARAEDILSWWSHRNGQIFTSLRFAQLYDERGACVRHQPWFGRIISYARRGLMLRLPPGDTARNFIHVRDAVESMIFAAIRGVDGIMAITHPVAVSYGDIAKQAYEVFGCGGEIVIAPEKEPFREFFFPEVDVRVMPLSSNFLSMSEGLITVRDGGYADQFEVFDVS